VIGPEYVRNAAWHWSLGSTFNSFGRVAMPNMLRRNQQEKADAADDGEGSPVIKYGRVSDLILKEPRNDARH
jgi:hypothetical protein